MLVNDADFPWWYMEIPKTATTAITHALRTYFSKSRAPFAKHWPVLPNLSFYLKSKSIVSIRDPYSRAISCWQFFCDSDSVSLIDWLTCCKKEGFVDINIEARPQSYWLSLNVNDWDYVIRQENVKQDLNTFWKATVNRPGSEIEVRRLNTSDSGKWVNRVGKRVKRTKKWQEYYCPDSIKLVQEIYAEDFERLATYYDRDFNSTRRINVA
jgi:hypothetical protein